MAEDKVITLRYKTERPQDMKVYEQMDRERLTLGISMSAYVKGILDKYYRFQIEDNVRDVLIAALNKNNEEIKEIVNTELQKLSGMLLLGIARDCKAVYVKPEDDARCSDDTDGSKIGESSLPDISEDFPEGLDLVLEKFME